jgi:DNA-binding transcriptional MerR regulator
MASDPAPAAPKGRLMTIGRLARATGVPVKTIRFYSDDGLLPPKRKTGAGYRLYDDDDRLRLETIRVLRDFGLKLSAIRELFVDSASPRDALALQLTATEAELRRLARRRAVLRGTLDSEADPLTTVCRLNALARLDVYEREAFLRAALDRPLQGLPIDEGWKDKLYAAAFADLPEQLDASQYDALVELFEIVTDPDFGERMRKSASAAWGGPGEAPRFSGEAADAWRRSIVELGAAAAEASADGESPTGPRFRALTERLIASWSRVAGREAAASSFLEMVEQHDPRAGRFWELVGVLRGVPPSPKPDGFGLLVDALRAQSAESGRDGPR